MIPALKIFIIALSVFTLLTSFLPVFNFQHWVFRATEYPGVQKFTLTLICAVSLFLLYPHHPVWSVLLIGILLINSALLIHKFYPYLGIPFIPKEVKDSNGETSETLKVLIANVLQTNDQYSNHVEQIKKADPDCFTVVEVDEKWVNELSALEKKYKYSIKEPLDNLYGMAFYSKHPIDRAATEYIVKDDIPSMHCELTKNGVTFFIQVIHPQPPSPTESNYSTNKDKELMLVADKLDEVDLPTLVIGDFNDVAWSKTTNLFQKESGFLDPRKGRGFFSTFHAGYWFMRFPLDHIFCSKHFRFINMKRLQAHGSDHFPILTQLQYDPSLHTNNEPKPDLKDEQLAEEMKEKEPTED